MYCTLSNNNSRSLAFSSRDLSLLSHKRRSSSLIDAFTKATLLFDSEDFRGHAPLSAAPSVSVELRTFEMALEYPLEAERRILGVETFGVAGFVGVELFTRRGRRASERFRPFNNGKPTDLFTFIKILLKKILIKFYHTLHH